MDNVEWVRAEASNGSIPSMGTRDDKRTQLIAVDDIGAVVAAVFADRPAYLGKLLELAGDEITELEKVEVLGKVIGRPVTLIRTKMSSDDVPDDEMAAAGRFFNGEAYTADIEAIRSIHPGLHNFEAYLRKNGWENLEVMPMPDKSNPWGG